MRKPKAHGKGIVKALGQSGTTGNFAKKRKKPVPYGAKGFLAKMAK